MTQSAGSVASALYERAVVRLYEIVVSHMPSGSWSSGRPPENLSEYGPPSTNLSALGKPLYKPWKMEHPGTLAMHGPESVASELHGGRIEVERRREEAALLVVGGRGAVLRNMHLGLGVVLWVGRDHTAADEQTARPRRKVVGRVDGRAARAAAGGDGLIGIHGLVVDGEQAAALHSAGGCLEHIALNTAAAPRGGAGRARELTARVPEPLTLGVPVDGRIATRALVRCGIVDCVHDEGAVRDGTRRELSLA
eukprot:scaffold93575_cov31-Tisochrysis_lutea.AAC.1